MEHLKGKHKARNPLLADWLHALRYNVAQASCLRRFGIGIIRMREAMEQTGLPAPVFRNAPDWFEVTLFEPGQSFMVEDVAEKATTSPDVTSPPPTEHQTCQPWYTQMWSARSSPIPR